MISSNWILSLLLPVSLVLCLDSKGQDLVEVDGEVRAEENGKEPVFLWVIPLKTLKNGKPKGPTKQEIFRASQTAKMIPVSGSRFSISLSKGYYCLFAFADHNKNQKWDPDIPEPLGWYADRPAGRFSILKVLPNLRAKVSIVLRSPRHFSKKEQSVKGGKLAWKKGYPVLQLSGDAKTRGYAHGKLIAPQIVDFFRFYILEDKFRSAERYENGFAKFLHTHFRYPKEFETECKAVIQGMKESGSSLFIPELGRDFNLTDLYAINGYIETRAMRSSCTQFAAWGPRTEKTDVAGGMITGRNMDGEIDIRKVTVSHFLLFAVDSKEKGQKRYVSMMWPGFVATISGMNEDGFYTMENAGLTGPGKTVDRLVPISWTMRETLAYLDRKTTPESLQKFVDKFDNSKGGVSGPGCITMFACPYEGQPNPAFILEGDRFGDAIRKAGEVRPYSNHVLVCSNHHRKYGVDEKNPGYVFGKKPSFSSAWRYEAGMHKLEAWDRIGKKIGTLEMQKLLQTVAHGSTEYSIITRPNRKEIDVAVASMKAELWDAPYRSWTKFGFEEFFKE